MNRKFLIVTLALLGATTLKAQEATVATADTLATADAATPKVESLEAAVPDSLDINAPMADYNNPKKYVIRSLDASGIKYIDAELQVNSTGLAVGDVITIPGSELSQAVSRLWSKQYFSDIKAVTTIEGDSVDINFVLAERPRIFRWLFDGISKSAATSLTEDLKLKRGAESLSDYAVEKRVNQIKDHYIQKGFRNVTVVPRIENDSVIKNAVNVTFEVSKNEKVRVGELTFEGNEVFTDKQLRKVMKKVHQKSINIFHNTKLREDELEEDFTNIIDFYHSKGYSNAMIVKDSVYVISPERIGLVITVDEGNKFYYRNIKWVGNSKYSTEQLDQMLGLKKGDAYDKKTCNC